MKRFERLVLYGGLLVAAATLAYLSLAYRDLSRDYAALSERLRWPHPGSVVPTFRAETVEGEEVTVGRAPAGGRQLLFVLDTECPYCRRSLPAWQAIAEEASREVPGLQVFGVATDEEGARVAAYGEEHGLGFPLLAFPERKLVRLYRARSVPLVLLLGEGGTVLYSRPGVLETEKAADSVLAAVRRPVPPRAAVIDESQGAAGR